MNLVSFMILPSFSNESFQAAPVLKNTLELDKIDRAILDIIRPVDHQIVPVFRSESLTLPIPEQSLKPSAIIFEPTQIRQQLVDIPLALAS